MTAPMPVLYQFFALFGPADREAVESSNNQQEALDDAECYLADFAMCNRGLTPEQAKTLFEKLEAYAALSLASALATGKKDVLVFRLAETLGLPIK